MSIELLPATAEGIARAAGALRRGDVVGMPTETVYGLAGNALEGAAVARIFAVKERPTFDPLIVHVAPELPGLAVLQAAGLVAPELLDGASRAHAEKLIATFWPGPLTLVLPRGHRVADLVTSGLPDVAVRMPRHPIAQALIREAGVPLAAPSANRFGRISPTSAQDVASELGDRIRYVVDGGPCELGIESTVLALGAHGPKLLRPGGVSREALESTLGVPVELPKPGPAVSTAMAAPGMLASHYAPRTPMRLLEGPARTAEFPSPLPAKLGVLAGLGEAETLRRELQARLGREVVVEVLSERGDLGEMARRLFAALRALDASGAEALFAEPVTAQDGLGPAIRDRLVRACAR